MEFSSVAVSFGEFGDMYASCGICVGCGVQLCQFVHVCCICYGSRL